MAESHEHPHQGWMVHFYYPSTSAPGREPLTSQTHWLHEHHHQFLRDHIHVTLQPKEAN